MKKTCWACSGDGVLPVLEIRKSVDGGVSLRESLCECTCEFAKRFTHTEETETIQDGKKKFTKKRYDDSQSYANLFGSGYQFPWDEQVLRAREPWVTYLEVYLLYKYENARLLRETKQARLVRDHSILEQYLGKTWAEMHQNINKPDPAPVRNYWN